MFVLATSYFVPEIHSLVHERWILLLWFSFGPFCCCLSTSMHAQTRQRKLCMVTLAGLILLIFFAAPILAVPFIALVEEFQSFPPPDLFFPFELLTLLNLNPLTPEMGIHVMSHPTVEFLQAQIKAFLEDELGHTFYFFFHCQTLHPQRLRKVVVEHSSQVGVGKQGFVQGEDVVWRMAAGRCAVVALHHALHRVERVCCRKGRAPW